MCRMNAQELTQKIHQQLCQKPPDKTECLKLWAELKEFCSKATSEELSNFRNECYGGEAFVMLATAIEQGYKI